MLFPNFISMNKPNLSQTGSLMYQLSPVGVKALFAFKRLFLFTFEAFLC